MPPTSVWLDLSAKSVVLRAGRSFSDCRKWKQSVVTAELPESSFSKVLKTRKNNKKNPKGMSGQVWKLGDEQRILADS